MIQEANWNSFKAKFQGREQGAFELLCYLLFCKEFKKGFLHRYRNHPGIETNPVKMDSELIGWQAKFYETKLSEHKADFIKSIDVAKKNHPEITKIIFYTNQEFAPGKKGLNPTCKIAIETHATKEGVEIEWRTKSFFEGPFVCEENGNIAQYFFSTEIRLVLEPIGGEELIDFLKTKDGDEGLIRGLLKKKTGNNEIQSIYRNLFEIEALKSSILFSPVNEIRAAYDKIVRQNTMKSKNETIEDKILNAGTYVKKLDFDNAHRILGEALSEISVTNKLYNFVYKEYLITGFISYSRQNDINGLRALLQAKTEIEHDATSGSGYIISMIFQEIFTRDIDLKGLHEVVATLDKIYAEASDDMKPAMANSLGLAYRRLGERTDIAYLEKAINIFKEGLALNTNNKIIEVELKDQMAIAHIRIFEFNKEEAELRKAEVLVNDCLELLEGPMDPRDYRLKPRILNNKGNIYKQRILVFGDIESGAKAISIYEEAELYWNKKDAQYDWALLKKNIAETEFALGKLTNDPKVLSKALQDCLQSIRYRNLKNSPYQWGKTAAIVFSIVILLNQLKSLKTISKLTRQKILSYTNVVILDQLKWSQNISPQFIQDARQAQIILRLK